MDAIHQDFWLDIEKAIDWPYFEQEIEKRGMKIPKINYSK